MTTGATDKAGNPLSSPFVFSFTTGIAVDNSPPVISITNPPSGSTVNGIVNITSAASDYIRVTQVDFKVDGVLKGSISTAPFTFPLDTTSLTNGVYTLTAVAHDFAENSTTSSGISITVNNPRVSLAADLENQLSTCSGVCHSRHIVYSVRSQFDQAIPECGTKKFILSGNLFQSGLYQKLIGNASAGCRSHPGGKYSSIAATLKIWIEEGALDN